MSISTISINTQPQKPQNLNRVDNNIEKKNPALKEKSEHRHEHTKTGVFITTVLGVASALAVIAKKQGFSLNPKKIIQTDIKDWAIFKVTKGGIEGVKVLEFRAKEILGIAAASVAGGLVGGAIFDDKKNFKAKLRESVSQYCGDVSVPLLFVAASSELLQRFEELPKKNPLTSHTNILKSSNFVYGNKFLKVIVPTIATAITLGSGILAGNKVSNLINEKVFGIKVDRKIKSTDLAPHIDDVCLAITLTAPHSIIGSVLSKLIPAALTVAGNEVGNMKEGGHGETEQKKA